MNQDSETFVKVVFNDTEVDHDDTEEHEQPVDLLTTRSSPDGEESDPDFVEEVPDVTSDTDWREVPRRANPRRLTAGSLYRSPFAIVVPRIIRDCSINREPTPAARRHHFMMSLPPSRDVPPRSRGNLPFIPPVDPVDLVLSQDPMSFSSDSSAVISLREESHHSQRAAMHGLTHSASVPGSFRSRSGMLPLKYPRRIGIRCQMLSEHTECLIRNVITKIVGHSNSAYVRSLSNPEMTFVTITETRKDVTEIIEKLSKTINRDEVKFLPIGPEIDYSKLRQPFYYQCGLVQQLPEVDRGRQDTVSSTCPDVVLANDADDIARHGDLEMSDVASCMHGDLEMSCLLHNYFDAHNIERVRLDYVKDTRRIVIVLPPSGHDHLAKLGWLRDKPELPVAMKFEGKELTLHALPPVDWAVLPDNPLEPDVIFVSHLPANVDESDLKSYFNGALDDEGETVRSVISAMIWPRGRALVVFDALATDQACDEAFHILREHVYQQPVKGCMIAIQRVPLSMRIRARKVLSDWDKDLLKYHFEARAVEKLIGNHDKQVVADVEIDGDSAFVTFVDRAALMAVLKNETSSNIMKRELQLEIYYTLVDDY